jgi:hypothetical protein
MRMLATDALVKAPVRSNTQDYGAMDELAWAQLANAACELVGHPLESLESIELAWMIETHHENIL